MSPVSKPKIDLYRYERGLRMQGCRRIAGVDESGRGALAGPLVAAAVILPEFFNLDGIRDCKRRTPNQRSETFERITTDTEVVWSVCLVNAETIDRRGMDRCNLELFRRAAHRLRPEPDFVLIDGSRPVRWLRFPAQAIIKGDEISANVAAASIVAKVTRDRIMDRLDQEYPDYGFAHNRGYGKASHWAALDRYGPIRSVHRFSIKRVQQILPAEGHR
jgi:ribonuclease HII